MHISIFQYFCWGTTPTWRTCCMGGYLTEFSLHT